MLKVEIHPRISIKTAERLDELKLYLNAPTLSALVQAILDELIEEMDKDNASTRAASKS